MDADSSNHNPNTLSGNSPSLYFFWTKPTLPLPSTDSKQQSRGCFLLYKCTYRNVNNLLIIDQLLQYSHLTAGIYKSPKQPLITLFVHHIRNAICTPYNLHTEPEKTAFILTQATKTPQSSYKFNKMVRIQLQAKITYLHLKVYRQRTECEHLLGEKLMVF